MVSGTCLRPRSKPAVGKLDERTCPRALARWRVSESPTTHAFSTAGNVWMLQLLALLVWEKATWNNCIMKSKGFRSRASGGAQRAAAGSKQKQPRALSSTQGRTRSAQETLRHHPTHANSKSAWASQIFPARTQTQTCSPRWTVNHCSRGGGLVEAAPPARRTGLAFISGACSGHKPTLTTRFNFYYAAKLRKNIEQQWTHNV